VLQLGDAVFHAAPIRNVYELCQTRSLPTTRFPLRARSCERPGPFGGVDPPGNAIACWYYRSSQNPLGNGISTGIETVPVPDSVCARFLNSRLTAQLLISCITGAGTTPTRGAGDICLNAAIDSPAEERVEPASTVFSPVARDYPSRVFSGFFRTAALRLFYQGTRKKMRYFARKIKDFFLTTCSPATQSG